MTLESIAIAERRIAELQAAAAAGKTPPTTSSKEDKGEEDDDDFSERLLAKKAETPQTVPTPEAKTVVPEPEPEPEPKRSEPAAAPAKKKDVWSSTRESRICLHRLIGAICLWVSSLTRTCSR